MSKKKEESKKSAKQLGKGKALVVNLEQAENTVWLKYLHAPLPYITLFSFFTTDKENNHLHEKWSKRVLLGTSHLIQMSLVIEIKK